MIQRSPEERENLVRFQGSAPTMGRGSTGEGSGLISRDMQVRILSPRPIPSPEERALALRRLDDEVRVLTREPMP